MVSKQRSENRGRERKLSAFFCATERKQESTVRMYKVRYAYKGERHNWFVQAASATAARLWLRAQIPADIISVQQIMPVR